MIMYKKKEGPDQYTHPISKEKFILCNLQECPDSYVYSSDRDEFFEMIWYVDQNGENKIYLVPPFRGLEISIRDKNGYLISFKREYLDEENKEFALDVFNLFNQQGQFAFMTVETNTQVNLEHLYELMHYEINHELGSSISIKSLLKVFLLHLIRQNQNGLLEQDLMQKRVYDFCVLLDNHFIEERKASFYSGKLGISEKRLNQILLEKMNKTITQLVHARLILEAKRRLTTVDLTIKEIAYLLNFKDHSYFSRFFKQQTGFTPEEFKTQITLKRGIQ